MTFEQKLQLFVVIILAGIVVVFAMLIFLTRLMREYGTAMKKLQGSMDGKAPSAAPKAEAGIPGEVIAAISAAVYMMYGSSEVRIASVRRAPQQQRSAWGMAGLLENTKPF